MRPYKRQRAPDVGPPASLVEDACASSFEAPSLVRRSAEPFRRPRRLRAIAVGSTQPLADRSAVLLPENSSAHRSLLTYALRFPGPPKLARLRPARAARGNVGRVCDLSSARNFFFFEIAIDETRATPLSARTSALTTFSSSPPSARCAARCRWRSPTAGWAVRRSAIRGRTASTGRCRLNRR